MNVLFLAYANSQSSPLPTLSWEDEGVFSVLVNRALKGHFFIHRDSFTTLTKINQYLGKYHDRLSLFLYSGHAGGQTLHLDSEAANVKGIAHQLGESARNGKLKLVILNGCSTAGQVKGLLDAGVPVVVATSAPVEDRSAAEFSIRFFQCLSEKRLSLKEAFTEALGPAQTATDRDLQLESISRGIRRPDKESSKPLWGLFSNTPELLDTNPIPSHISTGHKTDFVPNEQLTNVLFDTLRQADCRDIRNLQEKEDDGEYVEIGDKQTTIVNVLPFPIAIHLQKLLCPVEQENEGFDKISLRRLEQIGTVFYTTVEFMTFIMLAQLWESRLDKAFEELPAELKEAVSSFFYLSTADRATFDHLSLIRSVRIFLDTLNDDNGVLYFVEELDDLKTLLQESGAFAMACDYLANLHRQAVAQHIAEADVPDMCAEAESSLCDFFSQLGFLHGYTLTSIQNIDIQKYRHQRTPTFSHEMVRLMRAFGKPEQNYYLLPSFLDNRGVALIKGRVRVVNPRKRQFTGEEIGFLNLSPFIIDRNAFEANTDLSNLLFFDQVRKAERKYTYKNVKRPTSRRDRLDVHQEGPFEAVYEQLEAFRTMILGED